MCGSKLNNYEYFSHTWRTKHTNANASAIMARDEGRDDRRENRMTVHTPTRRPDTGIN